MRLIRTSILALAAGGTAVALATPPATAAGRPALTGVTRIVIYKGGGNTTPVGPPGPLPPSYKPAKLSTQPAKITVSGGGGTLVEDTSLQYSGVTHGGEWWYWTTGAILHAFYWDRNGTKTEVYNLQSPINDDAAWKNLGHGTYTPLCLLWSSAGGTVYTIRLNASYDWVMAASC